LEIKIAVGVRVVVLEPEIWMTPDDSALNITPETEMAGLLGFRVVLPITMPPPLAWVAVMVDAPSVITTPVTVVGGGVFAAGEVGGSGFDAGEDGCCCGLESGGDGAGSDCRGGLDAEGVEVLEGFESDSAGADGEDVGGMGLKLMTVPVRVGVFGFGVVAGCAGSDVMGMWDCVSDARAVAVPRAVGGSKSPITDQNWQLCILGSMSSICVG
jgi:hypothetical protein